MVVILNYMTFSCGKRRTGTWKPGHMFGLFRNTKSIEEIKKGERNWHLLLYLNSSNLVEP